MFGFRHDIYLSILCIWCYYSCPPEQYPRKDDNCTSAHSDPACISVNSYHPQQPHPPHHPSPHPCCRCCRGRGPPFDSRYDSNNNKMPFAHLTTGSDVYKIPCDFHIPRKLLSWDSKHGYKSEYTPPLYNSRVFPSLSLSTGVQTVDPSSASATGVPGATVMSPLPNLSQKRDGEESKSSVFHCQFSGCGKMYSKSSHLRVHERTHTGGFMWDCIPTR